MIKGFRTFLLRGNVIDLAVGVIIGASFGAIVDSMVKDLITPVLGLIGGSPDFSTVKVGPVMLGNFVNALIAFLLKAAGLYFLIVLPFSSFVARMAAAPPPPAPPAPDVVLLTEIRDLLKNRPA